MKKTITLRRISTKEFEQYFQLDGPGWRLALESDAAQELQTPTDKLEAVCLINKLYAINLQNAIMIRLTPFGTDKVARYFELGVKERADYLVEMIGKPDAFELLKEVTAQTRAEAAIGSNDKYPRPEDD